MAGQLIMVGAALICPSPNGTSLTRLLLSAYIMGVLITKIHHEEQEYIRSLGLERFLAFKEIVAGKYLPDLSMLFVKSEEAYERVRHQINALTSESSERGEEIKQA